MEKYTAQQYKDNVGQEQSSKSESSQSSYYSEKISARVSESTKEALEEIEESNPKIESRAHLIRLALNELKHVKRKKGIL